MTKKLIILAGLILSIIQISLAQTKSGRGNGGNIDPNNLPKIGIVKGNVIDAGIKQNLFKKKASINLLIRDIFNTRQFAYEAYGSNYTIVTERNPTTRMIQVSLSYKFGKMSMDKKKDRRPGESSSDENGDFEL